MTAIWLLAGIAAFFALTMGIAWAVVIRTGSSGYADTFWSFSIGIGGMAAALIPMAPGDPGARALIVAALVAVWSLRLGTHILRRTLKGGDDPRYAQLKKEWGDRYRPELLFFLEIQAGAAFVLVGAVFVAARNPGPLGLTDIFGVLIAIAAIAAEAVSDAQLAAFKADPRNKGKVCDVGLWSLSRHPNYFFEWVYWLAYVPIGVSFTGHPWGVATLMAPAMMYWLLVYVSGVPLLEAHMLRSRGAVFRAYQKRVRVFWPIPVG
jgi:steroid 5-alpha reductase family enzyme